MARQQRILQKHKYIYLSVLLFDWILVGDKRTTAYILSDFSLIYENECVAKSEVRGMSGGIVRKTLSPCNEYDLDCQFCK